MTADTDNAADNPSRTTHHSRLKKTFDYPHGLREEGRGRGRVGEGRAVAEGRWGREGQGQMEGGGGVGKREGGGGQGRTGGRGREPRREVGWSSLPG